MGVDEFKAGISEVIVAVSGDTTKPALTGVYFNTDDTALYVAATDGYRMAEKKFIDKIQSASDFDGLLINPAAYTHTSVAIADAIKAIHIKAIEIHLSNPHTREDYRKISYTASACVGVVAGFGKESYKLALAGLLNKIHE